MTTSYALYLTNIFIQQNGLEQIYQRECNLHAQEFTFLCLLFCFRIGKIESTVNDNCIAVAILCKSITGSGKTQAPFILQLSVPKSMLKQLKNMNLLRRVSETLQSNTNIRITIEKFSEKYYSDSGVIFFFKYSTNFQNKNIQQQQLKFQLKTLNLRLCNVKIYNNDLVNRNFEKHLISTTRASNRKAVFQVILLPSNCLYYQHANCPINVYQRDSKLRSINTNWTMSKYEFIQIYGIYLLKSSVRASPTSLRTNKFHILQFYYNYREIYTQSSFC